MTNREMMQRAVDVLRCKEKKQIAEIERCNSFEGISCILLEWNELQSAVMAMLHGTSGLKHVPDKVDDVCEDCTNRIIEAAIIRSQEIKMKKVK